MENLAKSIVDYLIAKKYTLSVAESLTGGLFCSMICEVPGASNVLLEGVIAYTNESKISRLGVKNQTLNKFTAISEQTASEMAQGIRKNLNSTIGIATTGLAGPMEFDEFGNKKGTVFIGVSKEEKNYVYRFNLEGNRNEIREKAVENCLLVLFDILLGKETL